MKKKFMVMAVLGFTTVVFAEEIPKAFKKRDLNKDMQIAETEWIESSRSVVENKGAVFNERKSRENFSKLDVNKDGIVTLEEYNKS